MKGKVEVEERAISVERTLDGIRLRISKPSGEDLIEVLLPFTDAYKLGRILISESRTGMTQMELLMRKMADIEHTLHKLEATIRKLQDEIQELKNRGTT